MNNSNNYSQCSSKSSFHVLRGLDREAQLCDPRLTEDLSRVVTVALLPIFPRVTLKGQDIIERTTASITR